MIIAGFEGVGKTTYARMHPEDVVDLDYAQFKFEASGSSTGSKASKPDPERTINPNWPFNYIEAIEDAKNDYTYVLISTDDVVLSILKEREEAFLVVRPFFGVKDEYRRRFTQRGESEEYIESFSTNWARFMSSLERVGSCVQITLDIDEYLADVVKNIENIGSLLVFSGFELLLATGAIKVIKEDDSSHIEIKSDKLGWINDDEVDEDDKDGDKGEDDSDDS